MKLNHFNYEITGPFWRLTVVYAFYWEGNPVPDKHAWGSPDLDFEVALGHCDGAGTGFGQRDMDWAFADEASAHEALRLATAIVAGRAGFELSLDADVLTVEDLEEV